MASRDFSDVDLAIRSTDPEDVRLNRLFGPWQAFGVAEAAAALASYDAPWWVCGGHAGEAFTGVRRPHDDIDIGFFTRDLDALRLALGDRFDLWSLGGMTFRPLTAEHPGLHDRSEQVWAREHAWAPWRMDLLATPDNNGRWVNKREPSMVVPLAEATWLGPHGVRYLSPELVLAMKAKLERPKDLQRTQPGHPWLGRL